MKYAFWLVRTVVLSLVFLEAAAWSILQFTGRPELAMQVGYMNGYKYHPYMAFHSDTYPSFVSNDPRGQYDIAILGGSTAAGVGPKNYSDAYFFAFSEGLKKRGKAPYFRNFAVPGFVSNQEHAAYKNFIFSDHSPRLLVSLTSFNDLYFYLFRTLPIGHHEFNYAFDLVFRQGYPDPPALKEKLANFSRRTSAYGLFQKILRRNEPIYLSSEIFDPTQPNFPEPIPPGRVQAVARNFLDNTEATALLTKRRGTKYVVVLQPTIYYGGAIEPLPNEWFTDIQQLNSWVTEVGHRKAEYDAFYALVLGGLRKMKNEGLLDYLDYRAALHGPVFRDPVHFNEEASQFLGEKMAADLAGKL